MTIGDQSILMFQDEDTHRIHPAMGSIYRPPMQYYSRFRAVSVFNETRPFFYYLVGPGQQPMQYCSSVEGISIYDETRPFFYYLVGPSQQPLQ